MIWPGLNLDLTETLWASRAQITCRLSSISGGCPGLWDKEDTEAGKQCWEGLLMSIVGPPLPRTEQE